MTFKNCTLILEDRLIPNGFLTIDGDTISSFGASDAPCDAIDLQGLFVAPGFVDMHCHGSGDHWFFDEPREAAKYHLREGTTSLLCSLWRNAGTYGFERSFDNIRAAMGDDVPIRGIHMEGPYLDPDLGSEGGVEWKIDEAEYTRLLSRGGDLIKQWTFDPTRPGARTFAEALQRAGIVLAVCYSKASPELLEEYIPYGLRVGSHILCATSQPEARFVGTREPGSDQFVLYDDRMIAEVIADSLGGHVRPFYLKMIRKFKGADRIALVSDCCAGGDTAGSDVNIINGELYGSRLTLSVAIRNMQKHTGASIIELVRMASTTPSKAIGLYDKRGSIARGKIADLVMLDEKLSVRGVVLGGSIVRREF